MGTTNRMIEIFNLTLNSRASRDEMQTKRPFGESDMDYRILLLVYRDTGNRSTVWYPPAGCVWCYGVLFFFFFYSPWRIYDGYDQCFYPWHSLRSSPLIFWCCNLPRALVLHCQPCSVLQEIACVSGYGSQWHNEIHFLVNARWVDSVSMCVGMYGHPFYIRIHI